MNIIKSLQEALKLLSLSRYVEVLKGKPLTNEEITMIATSKQTTNENVLSDLGVISLHTLKEYKCKQLN
jgi:hypothetical protein